MRSVLGVAHPSPTRSIAAPSSFFLKKAGSVLVTTLLFSKKVAAEEIDAFLSCRVSVLPLVLLMMVVAPGPGLPPDPAGTGDDPVTAANITPPP
jgi:hypothetical protein